MNWSKNYPPTEGKSYYNHCTCETPLGEAKIEWKGWKNNPDYGVEIDGIYIDSTYNLEEAKLIVRDYLSMKYQEIRNFLEDERIN